MITTKPISMKAYIAPRILCVPCECINLICSTVPQVHNEYSRERQLSHPEFLPTTIDNEGLEGEDNRCYMFFCTRIRYSFPGEEVEK